TMMVVIGYPPARLAANAETDRRAPAAAMAPHARACDRDGCEMKTRATKIDFCRLPWRRGFVSRSDEPRLLLGGRDEALEERVRIEGARFELGVELHADEPGMVAVFDRLGQDGVGRHAREDEALILEPLAIRAVDLVAMPMALRDARRAVH